MFRSNKRPLSEEDFELFLESANNRGMTTAEIRVALARQYPLRMRRIRKDLEWLEEKALQFGKDREDARWLL